LDRSPGTIPAAVRALARGAAVCAAFLACGRLQARVSLPAVEEYALKAEALVYLGDYFKCQESRDAGPDFVIAVVGKSPFGSKLDEAARGRNVAGRRIGVVYATRPTDLKGCDLVFICRSERNRAPWILDWARGRCVITVSDDEELLRKGVMVELLVEGGLMKLHVNKGAATSEGLSVSAQLLKIVHLVDAH
jgi:hypothetical protein